MNYDEWISHGIKQRYCTTAGCIVHEAAELAALADDHLDQPVDWDDPDCIAAVLIFPPEDKS